MVSRARRPRPRCGGRAHGEYPRAPDRSPPDLPGTRDFGGDPDSLRGATPVKPQPGDNPIPTDAPPAPGPGSLAPIPDSPEPAAIPPGDAVEYLRRATRAILDERRDHRRERGKPASPGARGW